MPFGKYEGQSLQELPASYILWLADQSYCPEVIIAYRDLHEEELREQEADEKALAEAEFDFDY